MYELFTDRARDVLQRANEEAHRLNYRFIGTVHIHLGIVEERTGVAANVLKKLDIDPPKIRAEVEKCAEAGAEAIAMRRLPQSPAAKQVIVHALEEARNLNHSYVGTEHILLGLLRETNGVAAQALMNRGFHLDAVRQEVLEILGHPLAKPPAPPWPCALPSWDFFGHPLAKALKLDLGHTQVTDADLKKLAALEALCDLHLDSTSVTDEGLRDLSVHSGLQKLGLGGTLVTDAGLTELAPLKKLRSLNLSGTQVTDVGLKKLAVLSELRMLGLGRTLVTDAGLKELAALKYLTSLNLSGTNITDAGLQELANIPGLREVTVWDAPVTDAGVEALRQALPGCQVMY